MVATVEAAGGVEAWEEARKALLATVFMSYPDLDEGDVDKYMAIRGLVSGTNREKFSTITSTQVGYGESLGFLPRTCSVARSSLGSGRITATIQRLCSRHP